MKKIGSWWIPDYDNPDKLKILESAVLPCEVGLNDSFKFVKNFTNAIDVGAWIGDSSLIIAKKFKKVFIFEPVNEVADCCNQNLIDNKIENFEIYRIGLSNKSGTQILLNKGKSFSGWINTVDSLQGSGKRQIEIQTELLDQYDFMNIDFIKIDVDSHEGFLLQGSMKFFQNNNPVIMIESKKRDQLKYQDPTMPDPIVFLEKIGYKIRKISGKADYILTR